MSVSPWFSVTISHHILLHTLEASLYIQQLEIFAFVIAGQCHPLWSLAYLHSLCVTICKLTFYYVSTVSKKFINKGITGFIAVWTTLYLSFCELSELHALMLEESLCICSNRLLHSLFSKKRTDHKFASAFLFSLIRSIQDALQLLIQLVWFHVEWESKDWFYC